MNKSYEKREWKISTTLEYLISVQHLLNVHIGKLYFIGVEKKDNLMLMTSINLNAQYMNGMTPLSTVIRYSVSFSVNQVINYDFSVYFKSLLISWLSWQTRKTTGWLFASFITTQKVWAHLHMQCICGF